MTNSLDNKDEKVLKQQQKDAKTPEPQSNSNGASSPETSRRADNLTARRRSEFRRESTLRRGSSVNRPGPPVITIPPLITYHRILTYIKIINNEISIYKHLPFDFTEQESTTHGIAKIIEQTVGVDSPIMLDSQFKPIVDSRWTRGEVYWGTNKKFYFVSKAEWEKFATESDSKFGSNSGRINTKKINYPVEYDYKERPKSVHVRVTGPRTFRQCLTRIHIQDNQIVIAKYVPFELNDDSANVPDIKKMIAGKLDIKDPVLLDMGFKEITDSIWTRGEDYWNHKRKFYFIGREEWTQWKKNEMETKDLSNTRPVSPKNISYLINYQRRSSYFGSKRFSVV